MRDNIQGSSRFSLKYFGIRILLANRVKRTCKRVGHFNSEMYAPDVKGVNFRARFTCTLQVVKNNYMHVNEIS